MEYFNEERKTPIAGFYDVIVAGGGPSGVAAAIAAGRSGKKTLLLERQNCLGGMWTSGLVNPLFDFENKGGIIQEIVDRINETGMHTMSGPWYYTFDFETMKLVLDRLVLGAGVDILFHTWFADVIMEGDTITGVIVENKSGRSAYKAKIVIDCTGDGDVAARAGAQFALGRPEDGLTQPMTLMFKIGNLDYVQTYPNPFRSKECGSGSGTELYDIMEFSMKQKGVTGYEWNFIQPCLLRLPGQHLGVMMMTHMRKKLGINAVELSAAEIEGRERVAKAMTDLKKYLEGFEHSHLLQTGSMIGVRETRRIKGFYELTFKDMEQGARFDDGFCIVTFGVDIHQPDKNSQEGVIPFKMKPYHIPYRCLVPVKIKNLLTAGRCISGDFYAHSSYRVTGDCAAMGQAAGTAAGLCLDEKKAPHELDGKRVVDKMVAAGAKR